MTDQQLINKVYYENLIEGREGHPVGVLGSLYLEENQKEIPDLSYIRFAQGEVYFHEKDFEAAIFKWENIGNELESWASKNMADAYIELGLPETAEGIYLSIETESTPLKIETGLQLLSIYMEQEQKQKSTDIIKSIVALDPDYPQLTEIARSFYEDQRDWHHAVRLAVDEGIRTGAAKWFDRLLAYVREGRTAEEESAFFNEALVSLYSVDVKRFEQLAAALWMQYKTNGREMEWVSSFNALFSELEAGRSQGWLELSALYQESYFDLINGDRLLKELSSMVPGHLENWLKIASPATSLFASSSVLAWNEMFPAALAADTVREAEELILNARRYPSAKEDSLRLFDSLLAWGQRNGIDAGNRMRWIVGELADEETNHVLIAGTAASGKAKFMNQLLGQNLLSPQTSSVIAFRFGDETNIREISDEEIRELENEDQFDEAAGKGFHGLIQETIIETAFPENYLLENRLMLIDIPAIGIEKREKTPLYQYVNFADSLLFMLDPEELLSEQEQDILMEISRMSPDLPVHFIVTRDGGMVSEESLEDALAKIQVFYPHAKLFVHSRNMPLEAQKREFADFVHSGLNRQGRVDERIMKLQYYIRTAINYLLDKRIIMENDLVEKVHWNEEMVSKLRGAIHQLQDLEEEKKRDIKAGYISIKESLRAEMLKEIPGILKGTSDIVKEDSDFGSMHSKLDEEMNERVQTYLETKILRDYYRALQEWIASAREEFFQAQSNLDELSQGFNGMYGEERIALECDFKVLDDWERDADRMTSGIQMERIHFLGRFTPGQFLLKSAGRLLSVLPQNNAMLYNKYKSFLENEDYSESAADVAKRFFKQFEIFEKAIERDITLFFRSPLKELNAAVEDSKLEISRSEKSLEKMRINPEMYRDPLNLFEVKLRQYEWMAAAGKQDL